MHKPKRIGFSAIMPTIKRIDGLRVVVYPNDHRPAHVHVIGNNSEAVFDLNCPFGPPEVRENYGFSLKELGRVKGALVEDLTFFCVEWSRIHGNP